MIEPPYESRAKRQVVIRSVATYSGHVYRGKKLRITNKSINFGFGRLFRVNKRSYNDHTRYLHSPRWRHKYGSW